MPVNNCCCGCCKCANVVSGLASSYNVNIAGTWDPHLAPSPDGSAWEAGGSATNFSASNAGWGATCTFGYDAYPGPGMGGYATSCALLSLVQDPGAAIGCMRWEFSQAFINVHGLSDNLAEYKQRTPNCADPRGIYDLYAQYNGGRTPLPIVPATITVS